MNSYIIPNLVKTCEILKILADRPEGISAAEMESLLRIPKTTAFRILKTLCYQNMVEKKGSLFFSGSNLIRIGLSSLRSLEVRSLSIPILSELADETGFTAHLAVSTSNQSLILEVHDSPNPVRVASRPGSIVPLYCSSTGKVFLAYQYEDKLEDYFSTGPFEKFTNNTIVALPEMKKEIEQIKKNGYAVDDREFYKDVYCLAAPVRDSQAQIVAAIGVTGPSTHFTCEDQAGIGQLVKKAAAKLSSVLGHTHI